MASGKTRVSVAEYLRREHQSEQKHEFRNGRIVPLIEESGDHAVIVANLVRAIGSRLEGSQWRVHSSPRVSVQDAVFCTYPDLCIIGEPEIDLHDPFAQTITNPQVIVEVVTNATMERDFHHRLDRYLGMSSVREFLLVWADSLQLEVYRPQGDGTSLVKFFTEPDSHAKLDSLGIEIPLREIYAGSAAEPSAPVDFDRSNLLTERRLEASMNIDAMSIAQAVEVMHEQDRIAVEAVGREHASIGRAIELVVAAFRAGGRLFYAGAGTSGRLGILDASECPPTFRSDPEMVQGIIAGGLEAVFRAKEGAEDSAEGGAAEMDTRAIGLNDVVLGIAAGGTTPFVRGALQRASERGAKTVFFCCVQQFENEPQVDVVIRPLTGPEVITGSTRLKAGTATKLVLNRITTIAMIQMGKVYENLMVDLRATNAKLCDRAARIVSALTGLPREPAAQLLDRAGGHVKLAILMHRRNLPAESAKHLLDVNGGRLRPALAES